MFSPPPNQYAVPPPYGVPFYPQNATPMSSPSPATNNPFYSPRYSASPSPRGSPKVVPRGHSRRQSSQEPTFAYASPRATLDPRGPPPGAYYSSPGGSATPMPGFYNQPIYATAQQQREYVSHDSDYIRRPQTSSRPFLFRHGSSSRAKHSAPRYASRRDVTDDHPTSYQTFYVHEVEDEGYASRSPPPRERRSSQTYYGAFNNTDHYYDQVPVYGQEPPLTRERTRRSSHSARTSKTPKPQPQPTPAATPKPPPKATEADARKYKIPAGYSLKNWDPTEEPILLLGSVFDANSLGKWIYDWTVYHNGPSTHQSEMAGELWLLLIQLAGKMKRAEECMPRIRKKAAKEMVEDFLESGDRLWGRFSRLLKACEEFMWKAAKKSAGEKEDKKASKTKTPVMGKNSGCEFVDSVFGPQRELERTEKLMTGMRLWSLRFDANCEEILRKPTA
jgi:hypothetical protein